MEGGQARRGGKRHPNHDARPACALEQQRQQQPGQAKQQQEQGKQQQGKQQQQVQEQGKQQGKQQQQKQPAQAKQQQQPAQAKQQQQQRAVRLAAGTSPSVSYAGATAKGGGGDGQPAGAPAYDTKAIGAWGHVM